MTYLCAAIFVRYLPDARRDIALAAEAGADMIELRIDGFATPDLFDSATIANLIRESPVPCIVTCRPTWEGGQSELSDEERIASLEVAWQAGAAYVDVELKTLRRAPDALDRLSPRLIVSAHDFAGRPDRLHNLVMD